MKSRSGLRCCLSAVTAVRMRSAKRLPSGVSVTSRSGAAEPTRRLPRDRRRPSRAPAGRSGTAHTPPLADLLRWQQLPLVVLVTRLPATTATARLALALRRPRRIRRRRLRGVRRVLRQPRFQLGDPRHHARNRLLEETLLLGDLPLQLGDAAVSGIGRANLPIGIFRLALSTTFAGRGGERLWIYFCFSDATRRLG